MGGEERAWEWWFFLGVEGGGGGKYSGGRRRRGGVVEEMVWRLLGVGGGGLVHKSVRGITMVSTCSVSMREKRVRFGGKRERGFVE